MELPMSMLIHIFMCTCVSICSSHSPVMAKCVTAPELPSPTHRPPCLLKHLPVHQQENAILPSESSMTFWTGCIATRITLTLHPSVVLCVSFQRRCSAGLVICRTGKSLLTRLSALVSPGVSALSNPQLLNAFYMDTAPTARVCCSSELARVDSLVLCLLYKSQMQESRDGWRHSLG